MVTTRPDRAEPLARDRKRDTLMSERAAIEPTRAQRAEKADQQLADVADRLCREFAPVGGADADVIRGQVREARGEFGSPKVLTHLSVMVERTVRERLGPTPFLRQGP